MERGEKGEGRGREGKGGMSEEEKEARSKTAIKGEREKRGELSREQAPWWISDRINDRTGREQVGERSGEATRKGQRVKPEEGARRALCAISWVLTT